MINHKKLSKIKYYYRVLGRHEVTQINIETDNLDKKHVYYLYDYMLDKVITVDELDYFNMLEMRELEIVGKQNVRDEKARGYSEEHGLHFVIVAYMIGHIAKLLECTLHKSKMTVKIIECELSGSQYINTKEIDAKESKWNRYYVSEVVDKDLIIDFTGFGQVVNADKLMFTEGMEIDAVLRCRLRWKTAKCITIPICARHAVIENCDIDELIIGDNCRTCTIIDCRIGKLHTGNLFNLEVKSSTIDELNITKQLKILNSDPQQSTTIGKINGDLELFMFKPFTMDGIEVGGDLDLSKCIFRRNDLLLKNIKCNDITIPEKVSTILIFNNTSFNNVQFNGYMEKVHIIHKYTVKGTIKLKNGASDKAIEGLMKQGHNVQVG